MTQGKRFGLSAVQKSDVWCRWKAGQSLHEIGRAFGKEHSSIRCLVSRHGIYHAKYFAFELTKRCASDSMEKLATTQKPDCVHAVFNGL